MELTFRVNTVTQNSKLAQRTKALKVHISGLKGYQMITDSEVSFLTLHWPWDATSLCASKIA